MQNIVLIGFMGSGKSFVGKNLAKKLDRLFLDCDSLIQTAEGLSIREIFETDGEAYFRNLEKNLFNNLKASVTSAVISTGGGMPTVIDNLSELGLCVYLDIGFEELLERLKADEYDKRPLFQNVEFAHKLYETRRPIYTSKANLIINASQSVDEIMDEIISQCKIS